MILRRRVLLALQSVRATYPEAQGIIGGEFNTNAHEIRTGYSQTNASHMNRVDVQLHAFVQIMQGVLVSLRTPSWKGESSGKVAKLDHLLGLGVEFTGNWGIAKWVGASLQDHVRVEYSIEIGQTRRKTTTKSSSIEPHQRISLNEWTQNR